MSRMKSFLVLATAVGLATASLALAEQGSMGVTTEAKAPAKTTSAKHSAHAKIDLNSASREQLMSLPGVNEPIAEKIIAARPLKAKDDLVAKGIMTKSEFSKISSKVEAHPITTAKK